MPYDPSVYPGEFYDPIGISKEARKKLHEEEERLDKMRNQGKSYYLKLYPEYIIEEAESYYETMIDKDFWNDLYDDEILHYILLAKKRED